MTKSGTGGSGGRRRAAFSLVELMAVVAAIGIIASLILPAIQASRESARRTQCLTNLRQTGIGLQLHHDVHGLFPPRNPGNNLKLPHAVLHWPALILPFIEEDALWSEAVQACDIDPLAYRVPPHTVNKAVVKLFICPTAPQLTRPIRLPDQNEVALSSYLGVAGSPNGASYHESEGVIRLLPAQGVFGRVTGTRLAEITDGASHTLMVGERQPPWSGIAGRWYSRQSPGTYFGGPDGQMLIPQNVMLPGDPCVVTSSGFGPGQIRNSCDRFHFWSLHPAGGVFLFADGSARFLSYSSAGMLPSLATKAGGEVGAVER